MTAGSPQRASVPDQVFRRLAEAIVSGRYAPGDRLPPQRTLAAEIGVNVGSVREGLKRLEQLRLVDVRHGEAMRVRDWRRDGGLEVLVHALSGPQAPDPLLLPDLLEARRLLLVEAARLAAGRRSDAQAGRLRELAAAIAAEEDDELAQRLDFDFYAELIAAAGNLVLILITNTIRELYLARAESFRSLVADRAALGPLYAAVAAAVSARDPGGAATAVAGLACTQEAALLGEAP